MARLRPRRRRHRARPPQASDRAPPAAGLWTRVLFLAVMAFLVALLLHTLLGRAGLEAQHPLRVFLTPLVAAMVLLVGLRSLPLTRRLRLSLLVALGLFLYALLLPGS